MRIRALGHGAEFFNDMRRCRAVRVAHAEIDNIFAAPTRSHFQLSSDVKNVRGKAFDTRKTAFGTEVSHRFLDVT